MGELLPTTEVAKLLGVPVFKIEWILRNGYIEPPAVRFGRSRAWSPDEVAALRRAMAERGMLPAVEER